MTKERKQEIISTYRRDGNDTGSSEVQIALLTERINELTAHLKIHTHDNHIHQKVKVLNLCIPLQSLLHYKF